MWLLPSLNRPANLARFFAACRATGATTPGIVIVDREDLRRNYPEYQALDLPVGWQILATSGVTQGDKLRDLWPLIKDCAWFGLIGDDCVPETPVWDRRLLAHLDAAAIVSCDDGWQAPKRLGNCWIMAGELVRALGYIFPPGLQHLYVDDVWEAIGREAGAWHCDMTVRVAHRHVLKGEAASDDTHARVYGQREGTGFVGGLWPQDSATYAAWRDGDKARAVAAAKRLCPERSAPAAGDEAAGEARLRRAKSRSVMIGTPIHDRPAWQYTHALAATIVLLERLGIPHNEIFVTGSSNLPKVRNELAARFLVGGYDDLVLIDADMGWSPNDLLRLIASDQAVIGGVGRRKCAETRWCLRFLPGAEQAIEQDAMGAIEVLSIGTGFLKISRDALLAIAAAAPEIKRPGDSALPQPVRDRYHRFFRFGDDESGEDYEFCALWRSCGGRVWVDPEIALVHAGETEYAGRLADLLVPAAPAPAQQEAAD